MPSLSSNAATYRRGGYTYNGYISTIPQTVVLTGTVSAVPTYPALTLSYTVSSGSHTAVTADMTVRCYSAGGTLKAVLRVASGGTITNISLPVNEFAANVYDVAVNDTFDVIKEYRIFDRLVSATAALKKDSRIAYSDQGSNPNPVCNSGGVSPGFSPSRDFYGSTSFTIDPDSSGAITHAWDFIDGTPSSSSSANPSGVVFPVGFRYVKHTATDDTNSKATVQYVPVWIHNDSYPPLRVQMDSLNAGATTPARVSFRLPYSDEGSITNLPNGTLIVYWEKERYNGTEASYGSSVTGRSHVKFAGYLVRDSVTIDAETDEVVFEAVSSLGILELTPALPQLMISDATPANWQEVKTLSTKKILWYLSYWHATLQDAWDFVWTDGLDLNYSRIAVDGNNSLADQLRDIAGSLNVDVTCDALGRIQFIRDPNFLTTVQRASRTTTYDFTTADIIRVEITTEHQGTVKTVRGEGITTGGAAVFSNAGNAPSSDGTGSDTLAKQIVSSQSDLNTRTGYHYARANSLYNGRRVPKGVRLTVPDGYDILEVGNREFVTLTLPSTTNTRGIAFTSAERWTVESKDISYDVEAGTKEISYTLDHETLGAAGVTYTPPSEAQNGLGDYPPLDSQWLDYGLDTIQASLVSGTGTIGYFTSDGLLWITTNFDTSEGSGGPTWVSTDLTVLTNWPGGTLLQFEVDAYSPKYLGTGTTVNGWICTTVGVTRITDIFGSVAFSTPTTLFATDTRRTMRFERGQQNFGIVASWYGSSGVYAAITTDGTTWSEAQVTADYFNNPASSIFIPSCHISPHAANTAYINVYTATGGNAAATSALYKTTNAGSSWAAVSSPAVDTGHAVSPCLAIPFTDTSGTTYFHNRYVDIGGGLRQGHFYRATPSGTTDISHTYNAVSYSPLVDVNANRAIAIPDADANTVYWCAAGHGTSNYGVFVTHDANAATPTQTVIVEPGTYTWRGIYPLSTSTAILMGNSGAIAYVSGTTVDLRTGNISTSDQGIGLCGG